ncbi:MAG: oligopeptidase A [Gammaproteobacteria bacterium]|nr:MAG: oligopeptidase A [Gammaproteobacteria bacterium]
MNSNPLTHLSRLPRFAEIQPEHIEPAISDWLAQCRAKVDAVVAAHADKAPSWESFIQPLELIEDQLERAWSPVSHLNAVMNSEALRSAYDACLPKLSEYATDMGQNKDLFRLTQALVGSADFADLTQAQQKTLENSLRSFKLGGIDLPAAQQKRYGEIQQRLSELGSRFEQNLLDTSNAWKKPISEAAELAGLPESALAMAKQAAEADEDCTAPYLLNLQIPCYLAVMTYADNRELRETLYRAYNTRASELADNPDWDNSAIIEETLALRHELAQLLGFASYADKSLATKMANSPGEVIDFLSELAAKSKPTAEKEFAELQAFAREQGAETLNAWDVPYYSEKLQQARYQISQETLKPWFPAPRVIQGLFDIVHRLYGIRIDKVEGVDVWHKDVQFFAIHDADGLKRGEFYLDLYARQHKRGGAWMDVCASRFNKAGELQTPVAYLTCNATPPLGDKPALLTHDEVITLFHEFGHGLHHMLTQVDYPAVSGISGVEWDAVELPSQFMENWCWEREALDLFARHYETDEPLPEALFQNMLAAKNFQSAMQMVRQLEFSLFDFRLHLEFDPDWDASQGNRTQTVLDEVRQQVAVVTPPAFNRFQNGFSHIFAGGYAAGYYSYKWAEVLSADAFAKFEENGIFDSATGQDFLHHILEQGGSQDAMTLFINFRGRKPSIEPLLRHCGLTT